MFGAMFQGQGGGGGSMQTILNLTLGVNSPSFDFSSIPQNFEDLELRYYLRSTLAGDDTLDIQFNGDTGVNYDYHYQWMNFPAATVGGGNFPGFAVMRPSFVCGTTAPAGNFSTGIIYINNYTNTVGWKRLQARGDDIASAAGFFMYDGFGNWHNTAAINRVLIFLDSGLNFLAGSQITLRGIL